MKGKWKNLRSWKHIKNNILKEKTKEDKYHKPHNFFLTKISIIQDLYISKSIQKLDHSFTIRGKKNLHHSFIPKIRKAVNLEKLTYGLNWGHLKDYYGRISIRSSVISKLNHGGLSMIKFISVPVQTSVHQSGTESMLVKVNLKRASGCNKRLHKWIPKECIFQYLIIYIRLDMTPSNHQEFKRTWISSCAKIFTSTRIKHK